MKSLTSTALNVVNSKRSLLEVIQTCNENAMLRDACSKSPDFWKDALKRLHEDAGIRMVLQRGDLESGSDWQLFCEGLSKGFAFDYVMSLDGDLRPRFAHPGGSRYDIKIHGVLPLPGTHGIWVKVEIDGPIHFKRNSSWNLQARPSARNVLQPDCGRISAFRFDFWKPRLHSGKRHQVGLRAHISGITRRSERFLWRRAEHGQHQHSALSTSVRILR